MASNFSILCFATLMATASLLKPIKLPSLENETGNAIYLDKPSILIIVNNMSCALCVPILKEFVINEIPGTPIYVVYDEHVSRLERKYLGSRLDRYTTASEYPPLFIKPNSKTFCEINKTDLCNNAPFLVLLDEQNTIIINETLITAYYENTKSIDVKRLRKYLLKR